MYKEGLCRATHGIKKNDSYEAEPLEVKLRRATEDVQRRALPGNARHQKE
nr:MAG TPA: hypothetical protein [Microviridae sp.]